MRFLDKKPLTEWVSMTPSDVQVELNMFANKWLEPLRAWTATDIVTFALYDDEQTIRSWLQAFLSDVDVLWPGQHNDPFAEYVQILLLPGDENSLFWQIARQNAGTFTLIRGAASHPILTIRFQRLTTIESSVLEVDHV